MRKIQFAWLPTQTLDGWIWFRHYKRYTSDKRTLCIPFLSDAQYDKGERREYEPGDEVTGYGSQQAA